MLTRPFTRLVVAFGQRRVTQRRLVEEFVLGLLILVPFGFVMGLFTSRLCTKIHFSSLRSDIWTTIVVFLVGDVLMEWLLPSLSCLPMTSETNDEYHYTLTWLLQSYGMYCPADFASSTTLLSPDATAILFSLRLVFLCLGVHIGESLCFVALTGGIATGKSTVSELLVEYNDTPIITNNNNNRRKPKKANQAAQNSQSSDDYKEGTVHLICADAIAHEILLPPHVLANENEDDEDDGEHDDDDDDDDDSSTSYIVHPKDSVYHSILSAFDGHDIQTPEGRIDRLKLGTLVFKDPQQRRRLNGITHPKILIVLIQHLLHSVFFGPCDITVADIPLLFESGKLSWLFAVTICVAVDDPSVQLQRLRKRNPELSKEECQLRIDSQLPLEKKQRMADIVIDNTGGLEDLSEQVEEVRKDLMGRLYGIGMSLLQMLLLIGGSTSIAVSSKFYTHWQQ
jgi:dephospho-CoA kinase